jgi:hypothetical protein
MTEEFSQRRLVGAPFRLVDLSDASFEQVTFKGARFRGVDLSDTIVEHATFQNRFRDVDLPTSIPGGFLVDVEPVAVTGLCGRRRCRPRQAELTVYPERVKLHVFWPACANMGDRGLWADDRGARSPNRTAVNTSTTVVVRRDAAASALRHRRGSAE